MPIGTSNGEYFEDAFDQAHTEMFGAKGTYDPKTDTFVADTEPTPKEIYFVRHGDTDLNKEGEKSSDRAPVRGWNDTPLNEQGKADAQKAADKLAKEPITHIVTSDLPRASGTAKIIGDKLGITPEEHPGLRTWNLGEYTGKTGEEVHDAVDKLCLHQPDVRPPGGESFNEFKDRILSTFGEIARDHAEHEVLVVSHNSPERILNAWEEAGQPASREIDRKQYHSDEGSVQPGQHKKFTIKDPAQLQQGTGPSFEERWPLSKSLQESLPSPLDVPHGKDEVQGWWKYGPKQTEQQKLDDRRQRQLDMQRELNRSRGFDTIESNDEPPKTSPYPNVRKIADVENSIEDLATKHGVEGSKMRDIIMDVLKHPMDYISPMPGELGMAGRIPGTRFDRGQLGKFHVDDLKKDFEAGLNNAEIGRKYGVTKEAIQQRRNQMGYEQKPRGRPK